MATASSNRTGPEAGEQIVGEERILVRNVGWDGYESLLEWFGDHAPRMTFADGDVEFMSPLTHHANFDAVLGYMIDHIADEMDFPYEHFTPLTLKRRLAAGGLEPDRSYYFANIDKLRGEREIDLDLEPPPDLCVEIEITNSLVSKLDVYARIEVPEIWRFDGEVLSVMILGPDAHYTTSDRSLSLPFVPIGEVQRYLLEYTIGQGLAWRRRFRAWVREVLAPIHRDFRPEG